MTRNILYLIILILYSGSIYSQDWNLFSLNEERKELLFNMDCRKGSTTKVKRILESKDSLLRDRIIIAIFNSDSTKFFAYLSCSPNSIGFDGSPIQKEDTIVFMGTHINSCTFLIAGINYQSNWYIKKYGKSYRNIDSPKEVEEIVFNSIRIGGYFKPFSIKVNEEYWEKGLFSIIVVNRKKIQNEIIKIEKKVNRKPSSYYEMQLYDKYQYLAEYEKYDGFYKIIVSEMIQNEEIQNNIFEKTIAESYFQPFFNSLIDCDKNLISYQTHNASDYGLIYPEDKKYIICPILLTNSDSISKVHFYIAIKSESIDYKIYKWEYFEPTYPEYPNAFGGTTVNLLREIAIWDYSFNYLWQESLYDKYIVQKEDGEFKYLTKTCTMY